MAVLIALRLVRLGISFLSLDLGKVLVGNKAGRLHGWDWDFCDSPAFCFLDRRLDGDCPPSGVDLELGSLVWLIALCLVFWRLELDSCLFF